MDAFFLENTSGWTLRQSNLSIDTSQDQGATHELRWVYSQASSSGTKYWWRVTVMDLNNMTPDTAEGWTNSGRAIDGNTSTYATTTGQDYIYINLSNLSAEVSKVWIYAALYNGEGEVDITLSMDYCAAIEEVCEEWVEFFSGEVTANTWTDAYIDQGGTITGGKIRIRAEVEKTTARLKEFKIVKSMATTETWNFTTASSNINISVTPETWHQGSVNIGSTNETTGFHFNVSNDGDTAIDVQIKAGNATNESTGAEWKLNASADHNKFALQFNRSDAGTWTTVNTSYDTFKENIIVGGYQTFDLKILMATTSTKTDPLSFNVTLKSVAS
jgi:hypothetical protein